MSELVFNNPKGQRVTTSLLIAEKFHKSHDKVMRDIAKLSCSQEFNIANFGVIDYIDTAGRTQKAYEMTKDGFSFLVFGYHGRTAGEFKEKFINAFNEGQEALAILDNDDAVLARAFNILANKQKALEIQLEQKTEQLAIAEKSIKEVMPKAQYHDEVLQTKNGHPITIIADELGMSAIKLNRILVKWGVQRKVGGTYVLTEKYKNRGYITSYTHKYFNEKTKKEETKILTTWTEEGRKFIHEGIEKLNKSGNLF